MRPNDLNVSPVVEDKFRANTGFVSYLRTILIKRFQSSSVSDSKGQSYTR